MHPLLAAWHPAAAAHLPSGAPVWDAHTHSGDRDPDGVTNTAAELLDALDEADHVGAVVCSSLDSAGYQLGNDRILEEGASSGGRLIPFLRVNPNDDGAPGEVERCLDAGHRGIKLHPRGESFSLDHPGVAAVAALAAERRAPLLIHAGRGMPPLAEGLLSLLDEVPSLRVILAHCAISDLDVLASDGHPAIFYDTAWWNPVDLVALFAWVDAGRILYASDTPYGNPSMAFLRTMRVVQQSRHSPEAVVAVFGGNLESLLGGSEPARLGVGSAPVVDVRMLQVLSYALGALAAAFGGGDPTEAAELAMRASDGPWPEGSVVPAMREALIAAMGAADDRDLRFRLLLISAFAAASPDVPAPPR